MSSAPSPDSHDPVDPAAVEPAPEAFERRAHLLPEESLAGSDDPERQAATILEESSERIVGSDGEHSAEVERRTSADTVPPPDEE